MNLLIRTYGHNHYAAFLLLVIPVFWWQFLFSKDENWLSKKESMFLAILLLLSSYILMIFSLGRLALLISLLQLILIFFLNKNIFFDEKRGLFNQAMAKAFMLSFSLIAIFFLFLSVPINGKSENFCPIVFSKKEICKPIIQNDRFTYWKRAILILKENLYFGAGLKNFNFASRHFLKEKNQFSSYAHNIFLNNLAECGLVVGGFFIFYIIYLFYKSYVSIKTGEEKISQFLWIASFSSLINALFDFDWNFFVIFSMTLIFLALILQDEDFIKKTYAKNIVKKYFIIIFLIAFFFLGSSFLAELFIKGNRFSLIVKLFPYLHDQINFLIKDKKFEQSDYENLYKFYKNDPNFLYNFSNLPNLDLQKKNQLQIELAKIDPILFYKNIEFKNLDYKLAFPLADEFIRTTNQHELLNSEVSDYWQQRSLSKDFFNFANEAYHDDDFVKSVFFYKNASLMRESIMGDFKAAFLEESNLDKATIFLKSFKDFNPNHMSENFYPYMDFYEKVLIYLFKNDRLDDFFLLSDAIFNQQYNFSWFLFRDLVAMAKTKEEKQRLDEVHQYFKEMTTWNDFLPLMQ